MNADKNSEKLGKQNVKKLLLTLSIPGIISLLVSNTYNVVDTFFVGKLGVNAISALSISYPFQLILIAIATGSGVGISSFISRSLGKKDKKNAIITAGNAVTIPFIYGAITLIIGIFLSENLIRLLVNNEEIILFATSYLQIILVGSVFLFYQISLAYIFRGQGNVTLPMYIIVISMFFNIILDPILIFGWFGLPSLGVSGAAIATVTARGIGGLLLTFLLLSDKNELKIKINDLFLKIKIIKKIYSVGFPSALLQIQNSVSLFIINSILVGISVTAIAAYGIYFKIQMLALVPIFGMIQAFVPIVGYNYGAENKKRVKDTLKITLITAFTISFISFLIIEIFPRNIISFFNSDPKLVSIGINSFRIIALLFFLYGPGLIISSFFLAIGKSIRAYIIFTSRDYLFFLPTFFILSLNFGLFKAWFSFPFADLFTTILGGIILYRYLKKINII